MILLVGIKGGASFLCVNEPVEAQVLIVQGWLPDYALKDADLNRIDTQIAELDQLQRIAVGRDGDDKLEFEERETEIEVLTLFQTRRLIGGIGKFVDCFET